MHEAGQKCLALCLALIPLTALSGCLGPSAPDEGIEWYVSSASTYYVDHDLSGIVGTNWEYLAVDSGAGLIEVHSNGSDDFASLHGDTGFIERMQSSSSDSPEDLSIYWPIHENQLLPEVRRFINPEPLAVWNQPLSMAWLAAAHLEESNQWNGFEVQTERVEQRWVLNATGPCLWGCPALGDDVLMMVSVHMQGETGELWPLEVRYEAKPSDGGEGLSLSMKRTAVYGDKQPVVPRLGETNHWLLGGQSSACELTFCQGTSNVPGRFANEQVMNLVQTSPAYLDWNQTHDARFVQFGVLGVDNSPSTPDVADFYLHAIYIVGHDDELGIFSVRTLQSDPDQTLGAVTVSDGFAVDPELFPSNPYEGRWHTLAEIFDQARSDGVAIDRLSKLTYLVSSPTQYPHEHFRIAIVLQENLDDAIAQHAYSLGTGQRIETSVRPAAQPV